MRITCPEDSQSSTRSYLQGGGGQGEAGEQTAIILPTHLEMRGNIIQSQLAAYYQQGSEHVI